MQVVVAVVTIEIDKELLPIFVPMPKKDAACAVAALKEALTLCQDGNLNQITGSQVARIQADGGEFSNQKLRDLCLRNMAIQDADPSLIIKWKSSGKWPLPCQMVFVLKPLTQTQQTADDADQDYKP